eukprot:TRINITY_DN26851_c0_g1_i1.p2 TRINITY_DN26851_c0_g1~~TRINITY_DN26851_c0_g1_i1.p2  ORF type:complete len:242 (-),score=27.69 TRINITY_DN26851_c0_g1_i1:231-956(-)
MAVAADYLRRHVLLRADEGVRPLHGGGARLPADDRGDSGGGHLPQALLRQEHDDPSENPALRRLGSRRGGGVGLRRRIGGGCGEDSGEVEVGEHDVSGFLDEDVFGFEVAVYDLHTVEVVEGAYDLGYVEADGGGGEDAVGLAVAEGVEVAGGAVGEGPGEELGGFCPAEEGGEEGVGKLGQDGQLPAGTSVSFMPGVEGGFVDDFEGERAAGRGGGVGDEEDGAHGSSAQDSDCGQLGQV